MDEVWNLYLEILRNDVVAIVEQEHYGAMAYRLVCDDRRRSMEGSVTGWVGINKIEVFDFRATVKVDDYGAVTEYPSMGDASPIETSTLPDRRTRWSPPTLW